VCFPPTLPSFILPFFLIFVWVFSPPDEFLPNVPFLVHSSPSQKEPVGSSVIRDYFLFLSPFLNVVLKLPHLMFPFHGLLSDIFQIPLFRFALPLVATCGSSFPSVLTALFFLFFRKSPKPTPASLLPHPFSPSFKKLAQKNPQTQTPHQVDHCSSIFPTLYFLSFHYHFLSENVDNFPYTVHFIQSYQLLCAPQLGPTGGRLFHEWKPFASLLFDKPKSFECKI